MPIAVVARAQRWSTGRTTRVALWTGVGHVLGSLALGVLIMGLGFGLKGILRIEGPIVGIVLVLTGIGLFLWSRRHPGHSHPHPHEADLAHKHEATHVHSSDHSHDPDAPPPPPYGHSQVHDHHLSDRFRRRSTWLIPAGIAASHDPTILPVFLAAMAVNVRTVALVSAVYALVTILAIVVLSLAAVWGGYQVKWTWLEQHAHHVTAAVLVALGIVAWAAL